MRCLLALLIVFSALLPSSVRANGRVVDFEKRIAGPYEIAMVTIPANPTVGDVHLTMTITDVSSATFVLDADVKVTAVSPNSNAAKIGPLEAPSNPYDPAFYDVSAPVGRVGVWTFTVLVTGELGDASADFPIEASEVNPITGIFTLIALVAIIIVLGLAFQIVLSILRLPSSASGQRHRGNSARRRMRHWCDHTCPARTADSVLFDDHLGRDACIWQARVAEEW